MLSTSGFYKICLLTLFIRLPVFHKISLLIHNPQEVVGLIKEVEDLSKEGEFVPVKTKALSHFEVGGDGVRHPQFVDPGKLGFLR